MKLALPDLMWFLWSIYLMPSISKSNGSLEGIPVSLMEAMAMGLPVVATRLGCIPELVHDGISGFLVEERDVDTLCKKLLKLVDNVKLRKEMGTAGCSYVQKYHNVHKLNGQLISIFQNLEN